VFSLIFRMVRNRELSEDLSQETFIKVLNALDSYRPEYKFSSWVFKIANNAAIDHLRRAILANPTAEESHHILGLALAYEGRFTEARAALREAAGPDLRHTNALAAIGRVAAAEGKIEEAREILAELYRRARDRYVSPVDYVLLHHVLGESDKAFEWLERAYQERRGWMVDLRVEPELDGMRADPRFQQMVRKMRLE